MNPTEKLVADLNSAGLTSLGARAEALEFHDYTSPHGAPKVFLASQIAKIIERSPYAKERDDCKQILKNLIDGKYDQTKADAEDWRKSPEGQKVFGDLVGYPKGVEL